MTLQSCHRCFFNYIHGILLLVVTRSEISKIKAINVGIRVHNYRDVMQQGNEEEA
jgi:hypothetical protein